MDPQSDAKKAQNHQLYLKQKALLDTFLEKHAISQAQYNKSLQTLGYCSGICIPGAWGTKSRCMT